MNFKKILFNTIWIFIISSIIHFLYNFIPGFIPSIFFPVNESVFEHLKLVFTASILYTLLSNIFYKEKNIITLGFLRGILTIIILLIIYLPINNLLGEVLPLTLIIMFISIFISEIIANHLYKYLSLDNKLFIILTIISYIVFTYLTYNPPHTPLFLDKTNNTYGIVK